MAHRGTSANPIRLPSKQDVEQAVYAAQLTRARAVAFPDDALAVEAEKEALYVLFMLILPVLRLVGSSWIRSALGKEAFSGEVIGEDGIARLPTYNDALDSLAYHGFVSVIEKLPSIKVDPERNVINLLKKIASRGLSRQYYKIYVPDPSPPKDESTMMAPLRSGLIQGTYDSETGELIEIADPDSLENEPMFFRELVARQWIDVVLAWVATIEKDDAYIFRARFLPEKPMTFKEIAASVSGLTLAGVQKRQERNLRKLTKHLRALGYFDQ